MTCEQTKGRFTDWISDSLSDADVHAVEQHLAECAGCQAEFAGNRQLWEMMGQIKAPAPSTQMTQRFDATLKNYKESIRSVQPGTFDAVKRQVREFFNPDYAIRYAYAMGLLLAGGFIGYAINGTSKRADMAYTQQIDTLATQVQEMKRMMMLTLIENPSATERLRAVSYTSEITSADPIVIEALVTTLNNDPNVNVRLVTLEALSQYASDPGVRKELIQAMLLQDSPMVQAALADVMVKLQEKKSIKAFRHILEKQDLNQFVKAKLEQSIKDLS
jgi:hypothetical protein